MPHGAYCGSAGGGLVTLKVAVVSLSAVNMSGSIFGQAINCPMEKVVYNANNGSIVIPSITQPTDCVGQALSNEGVDPTAVTIVYNAATNVLTINTPLGGVVMSACSSRVSTHANGVRLPRIMFDGPRAAVQLPAIKLQSTVGVRIINQRR